MESKFLENMGIAFVKVDYEGNVICTQKDEHFSIELSELRPFLKKNGWEKEFDRSLKGSGNQIGTVKKIDKMWVSFEIYTREKDIDIKLENVSKMKSEKLMLMRVISKNLVKFGKDIAPLVLLASLLYSGSKYFMDLNIAETRRQNYETSKEIKEARTVWFQELKKRDSVFKIQTEVLFEITESVKDTKDLSKTLTMTTKAYRESEHQRLGILTELAFLYYINPETDYEAFTAKIKDHHTQYLKIQDSLNREFDKKHGRQFRKKEF